MCIGPVPGAGAQLFEVLANDDSLSPGEFSIAPHEALIILRDILSWQRLETEARRGLKPLQQTRKMMGVPLPHKPKGGASLMSPADPARARTSIPTPFLKQSKSVIPSPHLPQVLRRSSSTSPSKQKQEH